MKLNHPFVTNTQDNFVEKSDNTCLVMKFYPKGDFMKFLKENQNIMSEKEILRYLAMMILSIHYLHTRQIYHMDVKFENFLVDMRNQDYTYLSLCDFGASVDKKLPHNLILGGYEESIF
jgi:serine/threonine protein kinase